MWVRSQDSKSLAYYHKIYIHEHGKHFYINGVYAENEHEPIGVFDAEGEALEVLNIIQAQLDRAVRIPEVGFSKPKFFPDCEEKLEDCEFLNGSMEIPIPVCSGYKECKKEWEGRKE